ncbi:MAG: Fic family protein [Paludibacteraceae bacterium]|nr:Fic family protein [Paludibacteraceae bacterium]
MTEEIRKKLDQCEQQQRMLRAYRPLSSETLQSLRDYYRVGLTYTSNALEGNSLTESETKVVIEDGLTIEGKPLRDVYEAVGHAKAYDFLHELSHDAPLTEETICTLHRLFYQQIDSEQAGVYRKVPVFISGSQYAVAPVAEISKRMQALVQWYNNHEGNLHPIELAAELHKRFVYIHPFVDGNGRVSRLLMNLSLMRNDYNVTIIPAVCRSEYISALEQGHKNADAFIGFVADRVIMTQLDILRLFRETEPEPAKEDFAEILIETIIRHPGLNAPTLAERTGRSLRTTQRYLSELKKDGRIRFEGVAKKGGYYAL